MKIELLKRSLNETREQMKALLVKAESETRSMDQQELAKFDELKGKAESLMTRSETGWQTAKWPSEA